MNPVFKLKNYWAAKVRQTAVRAKSYYRYFWAEIQYLRGFQPMADDCGRRSAYLPLIRGR